MMKGDIMSDIGDFLRSLREKNNLTLKDLSDKSGVGQSTISDIETGNSKSPRMNTLSKLAKALGVSINDFFDSDETIIEDINIPQEYTDKYKVTSRDKKQYLDHMKKATEAFFMNDEFDEEDKKEILDTMNEIFWKAKAKNKRNPKSE